MSHSIRPALIFRFSAFFFAVVSVAASQDDRSYYLSDDAVPSTGEVTFENALAEFMDLRKSYNITNRLLSMSDGQLEPLNLTDEQFNAIESAQRKYRERSKRLQEDLIEAKKTLSEEQFEKKLTSERTLAAEYAKELKTKFEHILLPHQTSLLDDQSLSSSLASILQTRSWQHWPELVARDFELNSSDSIRFLRNAEESLEEYEKNLVELKSKAIRQILQGLDDEEDRTRLRRLLESNGDFLLPPEKR